MGFRKYVLQQFAGAAGELQQVWERIKTLDFYQNETGTRVAQLHRELKGLVAEISNNGVIRDLRRLEKENAELRAYIDNRFDELGHNGVATAINKLNKEVFGEQKDQDDENTVFGRVSARMFGLEPIQEPTLAGKVNAIVKHLGIDLQVEPEKTTPARVTVKKPAEKKPAKRSRK